MPNLSRRALLGAALLGALLALPVPAARAAASAQDRADVARVEAYLNQIRSLSAGFIQVSPQGALSEGEFYLRRPGRLRFAYAPPSPLLIVGDGVWVVLYDSETNQVDRIPIGETPLSVLTRDKVDFSKGLEVAKVARRPGVLEVTVVDPAQREQGSITLVFADQPLELRQWLVTDSQGQVTTVQLRDARANVDLDAKLFVFVDPPNVRQRQR
jgi:outer membrane lipoprotein-sorting protein